MLALVKLNPLSHKILLAGQPRKHATPHRPNLAPSTLVRTLCILVRKNHNRDALCRHTSYSNKAVHQQKTSDDPVRVIGG